jgi:hypothetical protein
MGAAMPGPSHRLAASVVVLVMLGLAWAPNALAHSRHAVLESPPVVPVTTSEVVPRPATDIAVSFATTASSTPGTVTLVTVVVAALLLGAGAVRAPVTTLRVVLALLATVTAAESALHSVHHLDDPTGAKDCQVLTITQQLHGDAAPESPSGVPPGELRSHIVSFDARDTAQAVRRPGQGRAPPLPLA